MSVKKDQNTDTVVLLSSGAAENIVLVMNKSYDIFKCYFQLFKNHIHEIPLTRETCHVCFFGYSILWF